MKKLLIVLMLSIGLFSFEDMTEEELNPVKKTTTDTSSPTTNYQINLKKVQKAFFKNDKEAVVVYKYDPTKIMKIRTRVLANTLVVLPKGDVPISHSNGSPGAYSLEFLKDKKSKFDLKNAFNVKPKFIGTDTTLQIIGKSGRIYNFYIYSVGIDSAKIPNSTVYITPDGKLPEELERTNLDEKDKQIIALQKKIHEYEEKLNIEEDKKTKNLKKFNIANIQLDYKFDKKFKLQAVFNDNEFTYFKFADDFDIPKVFYKDIKKDKISMNFIIFENVLKVRRLSKGWSLELGGEILNIEKIGSFNIEYSYKKLYADMTKTKYNFKSVSGDETLTPKAIFYDDEFTYFKFDVDNGFKKFPVPYRVVDGYDNPVDFEIVNNYVVVKNLNEKYTLRLGEKHNCIRLYDE